MFQSLNSHLTALGQRLNSQALCPIDQLGKIQAHLTTPCQIVRAALLVLKYEQAPHEQIKYARHHDLCHAHNLNPVPIAAPGKSHQSQRLWCLVENAPSPRQYELIKQRYSNGASHHLPCRLIMFVWYLWCLFHNAHQNQWAINYLDQSVYLHLQWRDNEWSHHLALTP